MNTLDFKYYIKNIRKEALEIGFSIKTMDGYLSIWNNYIKWKNENSFTYNEKDYSKFLLEYYHFDANKCSNELKSRYQQLMRSKRILDDFDTYKQFMLKRSLPNALYSDYPSDWNVILDNYLDYLKNIRQNSDNSIKVKKEYLIHLLSYFHKNGLNKFDDFSKQIIIDFINTTIEKGNVSKRRFFYVLRDFLNYLFIENVVLEDFSIYIPKIRSKSRKKLPTYLKQNEIEELLTSIPKNTKVDIRNYTIILIAARLGLRVSDILNIKLKDIDWKNNKLSIIQPKTNTLNILPLSKEVGWAIIDYIKNSRPKCTCEYLFVQMKYPFKKMEHFDVFNKYFTKCDFESESTKKGIHNLRHSLATNMLDNDIPISIISSTLGHSNINTTASTYIKIDIKNLKKVSLEVDE